MENESQNMKPIAEICLTGARDQRRAEEIGADAVTVREKMEKRGLLSSVRCYMPLGRGSEHIQKQAQPPNLRRLCCEASNNADDCLA